MEAAEHTELDGVCLGLQTGHIPLHQSHQGGRGQEIRQGMVSVEIVHSIQEFKAVLQSRSRIILVEL
jgi:hypothetical protein